MKTNNSGRNRGRWDRPPVANEDDLAMAALLGEANSQEIQHQQQQQKRPQNNKSSRSSGSRWQQPNNAKAAGADDSNNYYGRASSSLDRKRIVEDDMDERDAKRSKSTPQQSTEDNDASEPAVDKQKADFGLSGALANDTQTGNIYNGIQLKFSEPPEARIPNTRWRLYVFRKKSPENTGDASKKDDGLLDTYHISRQSAYLFGRERKVADIAVDHPSLSKQHAVLQYRALPSKNQQIGEGPKLQCKPYLMDLGSTNGTFINGVRLDSARYYELRRGDVITLGASTREYVILTEQSAKSGI